MSYEGMTDGMIRRVSVLAGGNTSVVIPAGWMIMDATMYNTTANAVTGGIIAGTTAGGVDVMAALAVGANANIGIANALILKKFFSPTVDQTISIQAVVAWNSAIVNVSFIIAKV